MLDNHKNILFALILSVVFVGCFMVLKNKAEISTAKQVIVQENQINEVKK